MDERSQVVVLANKLLDEPNADPDDDLRSLARQLLRRIEEVEALRTAIQKAVKPHEFNCGWVKHPDFIKMVPADGCTCGLDRLMRITASSPVSASPNEEKP